MSEPSSTEAEVPVWARSEAFPPKPAELADYGFIDAKGNVHTAQDEAELSRKVEHARNRVDLVWTLESEGLIVPEQIVSLRRPLRLKLEKQAQRDISDGRRMGAVFGVMLLWTLYAAWTNSGGQFSALYTHQLTGLASLLLLFFGILPLSDGIKTKRRLARTEDADLASEIPEAQFEVWLDRQKVPATYFLLGCLVVCGLVQVYFDRSVTQFDGSIMQAGLLKQLALDHPELADGGAWWRMLTAPMLHGNVIHFVMNGAGLLYLGRRTEALARWPHMLLVFIGAAWVGGLASFYWIPDKIAVGASGGLMGLLGFMLVFEYLHPRIVPKPARSRLLFGVVMLAVIGLLGMSFIDNAAHAGGLLAGMVYAVFVFPASVSTHRPGTMIRDCFAGVAAGGVILFAVYVLCIKVLG
ncbi:MAG: rhomboid family intramembrane serine protease [Akkermansiaceae bacterium]|nr:rhomboid family intramembrane serine protease [Akkermansiaceae bacterium]